MSKCNGCKWLRHEPMAKGTGAMACDRRGGRIIDYSPLDRFDFVYTPTWCEKYGGYEAADKEDEE